MKQQERHCCFFIESLAEFHWSLYLFAIMVAIKTYLIRTYSFAIRPRQTKKPWDANKTLQERKRETGRREKRGIMWVMSM